MVAALAAPARKTIAATRRIFPLFVDEARSLRVSCSSLPLAKNLLGDGQLLHVAGAFVNPANLGVAIKLLYRIVFRESDAAEDFHRPRSRALCNLRGEIFRHGSFGDEGHTGVAHASAVVD